MHRSLYLAAAVSMAAAACAPMDGEAGMSGQAAMSADMTPENRAAYLEMAASSDMYEVQSSQIALSKAQNPAMRTFAQMMVRDHTQASQQLMAAATAAGMPAMSPRLMPMHAQMIAQLQASSNANFDKVYSRQQLMAHQSALALHSNYASQGDTPALRAIAGTITPVVRAHLEMVQNWPR